MRWLICEGSCNPQVREIDLAVKRWRARFDLPPAVTEEVTLLRAQRALRYTLHDVTGEEVATCQHCGTSRRYGRR